MFICSLLSLIGKGAGALTPLYLGAVFLQRSRASEESAGQEVKMGHLPSTANIREEGERTGAEQPEGKKTIQSVFPSEVKELVGT